MWRTYSIVFVFFVCVRDVAVSVKITELRVPAHVLEGGQSLLGCQYEMEDDTLYSVKWYKDDREFYRHVPLNDPPHSYYVTPGVHVDLSRSSSDVVALVNFTQDSGGLYRCEVSGETPYFTTVFDQKYISVHLLPETPPLITGLKDQYQFGDRAVVNCSSAPSRPEVKLKWWINDRPAGREHLQGPWYRIAVDRPDATETIIQLRFTVMSKHFKDGLMKLKCQAVMAPLYQDETVANLSRSPPESVHPNTEEYTQFEPVTYSMPKRDTNDDYPDLNTDSADRRQVSIIALSAHLILHTFL